MSTYMELSVGGQALYGVFVMLLTTSAAWMLVNTCTSRYPVRCRFMTAVLFGLHVVCLQGSGDCVYYVMHGKGTLPGRLMAHLPYGIAWLALFVLLAADALLFYYLGQEKKKILPADAIKESLDLLPDGVCFFQKSGMPILVNEQMNKLSAMLTGEGLMNGAGFYENISEGRVQKGVVSLRRGSNPAVQIPDGTVWDFRMEALQVEGHEICELLAVNVTPQFLLNRELNERNERLNAVNARLRNFSKEVEQVTRQKEILAAKLKLHDDVGRSLLVLRAYLAQPVEMRNRQELLPLWQYIVRVMEDREQEDTQEESLIRLRKEAEAFHVEIVTQGIQTEDKQAERIILAAVRECASNTAKHAGGDKLFLTVEELENEICATLTNNGRVPENGIRETGGLKSLRRMVEEAGGSMEIATEEMFTVCLRLPMEVGV